MSEIQRPIGGPPGMLDGPIELARKQLIRTTKFPFQFYSDDGLPQRVAAAGSTVRVIGHKLAGPVRMLILLIDDGDVHNKCMMSADVFISNTVEPF